MFSYSMYSEEIEAFCEAAVPQAGVYDLDDAGHKMPRLSQCIVAHTRFPNFLYRPRETGNITPYNIYGYAGYMPDNKLGFYRAEFSDHDVLEFHDLDGHEVDSDILFPEPAPGISGDAAMSRMISFIQLEEYAARGRRLLESIESESKFNPKYGASDLYQADRRNICQAVLSQWQASTFFSHRSLTGMMFENFQMDDPALQYNLLKSIEAGCNYMGCAYGQYAAGLEDMHKRSEGYYLTQAGDEYAGIYRKCVLDYIRRREAGEIPENLQNAASALDAAIVMDAKMRLYDTGTRDMAKPGLKFEDFGFVSPDSKFGQMDLDRSAGYIDKYISKNQSDLDVISFVGAMQHSHEYPCVVYTHDKMHNIPEIAGFKFDSDSMYTHDDFEFAPGDLIDNAGKYHALKDLLPCDADFMSDEELQSRQETFEILRSDIKSARELFDKLPAGESMSDKTQICYDILGRWQALTFSDAFRDNTIRKFELMSAHVESLQPGLLSYLEQGCAAYEAYYHQGSQAALDSATGAFTEAARSQVYQVMRLNQPDLNNLSQSERVYFDEFMTDLKYDSEARHGVATGEPFVLDFADFGFPIPRTANSSFLHETVSSDMPGVMAFYREDLWKQELQSGLNSGRDTSDLDAAISDISDGNADFSDDCLPI